MSRDSNGFPHQVAICEEERHSEALANAKLAASAPEILEALRELIEAITSGAMLEVRGAAVQKGLDALKKAGAP